MSSGPACRVTTCNVIPALKARLMSTWSTISTLRSPSMSARKVRSFTRLGRLERSIMTSISLSPRRATAEPMRLTPALFPSASPRHCPHVMATSSAVWWSSIHWSPDALTVALTPLASRSVSRKASSVAMPVSHEPSPLPSSRRAMSTLVSFVARARAPRREGSTSSSALAFAAAIAAASSAVKAPSSARRRQRAKALKVLSTMWCALSPRCFRSASPKPEARASSAKKGSVSAVW
mmetsp:Transcript_10291/g.32157  ORF Transcript_10291/g.32157 Transcript_10291/m.32157 type:complete len:236 (-) Transcript_10291:361-1068(-)